MRRRADRSLWAEVPATLLTFIAEDWLPFVEGAPPVDFDPGWWAEDQAVRAWKRARAAWVDAGHPFPEDSVDRMRQELHVRRAVMARWFAAGQAEATP